MKWIFNPINVLPIQPRWSDLDINQHVNNVKYIGWILESAPPAILESHELKSLTLQYRRECGRDSVLQSLSASSPGPGAGLEHEHLLRLDDGAEIVRGRTEWRPKLINGLAKTDQIPA